MPSFDIVSEVDEHEMKNATDQTTRELSQRFDFRGTDAQLEKVEKGYKLTANSEERVKAALEVLKEKMIKRKVSLKFIDPKDPEPAGGQSFRLLVDLKKGIDKENAKKIVQIIKDDKSLKVQSSVQGEAVRVTGKKRDDLQAAMAIVKVKDMPVAVAFNNFRD